MWSEGETSDTTEKTGPKWRKRKEYSETLEREIRVVIVTKCEQVSEHHQGTTAEKEGGLTSGNGTIKPLIVYNVWDY